jgi:hypothetical protein
MLAIYMTAAGVGGALILLPILLGHHGSVPGHGDAGHDHAADTGGHGVLESTLWLTVFSMRFWSYACAFFGFTGLLFTSLHLGASEEETLAISGATGFACGLVASAIIARLRSEAIAPVPSETGYVGVEAEVLLEIQPKEPGRIRLSSRGSLIDLPAQSQRGETFPVGARVLVVEAAGGVATVVAAPARTA